MKRSGTRPRVMIVDDDAPVRAAIRQTVDGRDLEVVGEAGNSREALALARALAPDLILVDIDMPDVSGIALVRALTSALPATITVMLTVSDARTDLRRAIEAGARGYLVKGMSASALRRAVVAASRGELAMPRQLAQVIVSQVAGVPVPGVARDPRLDLLSAREIEVLALLADGLTDRMIADILTVSTRTVEAHVGRILRKLDVRNRAAAMRVYLGR